MEKEYNNYSTGSGKGETTGYSGQGADGSENAESTAAQAAGSGYPDSRVGSYAGESNTGTEGTGGSQPEAYSADESCTGGYTARQGAGGYAGESALGTEGTDGSQSEAYSADGSYTGGYTARQGAGGYAGAQGMGDSSHTGGYAGRQGTYGSYAGAQGGNSGYAGQQGAGGSYAGAQGSNSGYAGQQGANGSYAGAQGANNGYAGQQGANGSYAGAQGANNGYAGQQSANGGYTGGNHSGGGHRGRQSAPAGKKPQKLPKSLAVVGLALLFGFVSSATFLASNLIGTKLLGLRTESHDSSAKSTTKTVGSNAALAKTSTVVTSDVSGIVEQVMPSIVSITNMTVEQVISFFGGAQQRQVESAGTGIIISQNDEELLIVTNNHVVEGYTTLTVTFDDGASVEANVKGTNSEYDLAVIAVDLSDISDSTMEAISVASLGDSTKLKVGEPAIAIGNALGYGQSVTAGIISALNRSVSTTDPFTGQKVESGAKLIQTDAAINPGNSGGALVNASGDVIGINSSKLVGEQVEGVGYAIPISDVSDLIENLMNQTTKRRVAESERGVIGISGRTVPAEYSQQLGMPAGVYVAEVAQGGGAHRAGLTKGSVITAINGTKVTSMEALQEELQYYAKGETVTLTIQIPQPDGEYQENTIDVTLTAAQ